MWSWRCGKCAVSSRKPTAATKEDSSPGRYLSSPVLSPPKDPSVEPGPRRTIYVIVTYWHSFEDHEKSHADELFNSKFAALAAMCSDQGTGVRYAVAGHGERLIR